MLLYASGYRPEHHAAHFRTLASLPLILGIRHSDDEVYLQACRTKRNAVEYDRTGGVTEADVEELAEFAADLRVEVMQWLRENRPELLEP